MDADHIARLIADFSYPAVFLLLVIGGLPGAPVSEELVLVLGGIAIAKGGGSLPLMMASSIAGTLLADFLLYSFGRKLGPAATKNPKLAKVLTPERVMKVERYFAKYGAFSIFLAGFVAGLRMPTFLVAGMVRFPRARFLIADLCCILIFGPGIIWLGYRFGLSVLDQIKGVMGYVLAAILAVIVVLIVVRLVRWWRTRPLP